MSVATLRRQFIMFRKLGLIGILLVLSVALGTPAWAQVQTGSIFVKATDEQGASVPGANVTLTSPILPQSLTGVTDSTGSYRFPSLGIGTYSVKVALAGFQTITREGIVVLQGQTSTLDFSLKVSTVSEEVTVKGETPVVDAKSANVNVNLDKALLDTTPGGKDIWSILEYKAPGVIFDAPDVGGNQGGLQRGMTSRGTPNAQNTQMLNGVNVNDPAAQGFSMIYYTPSTFENIQVSSGAQDISVGTGGIFINMVTKSGTNRVSTMLLQTYQGQETQWDNIDDTLKGQGFRPEAAAVDFITNTNGQIGGPLRKNRLFYFVSGNYQDTRVNVPGFPAVTQLPVLLGDTSQQDTTDIAAGSAKLTFQANTGNRFEGYLERQLYDKPNRGAGATNTQDSDSKEYDFFNVAQIAWNSVLTDRMFVDTKVSYNNTKFPLSQKTQLQPLTDAAQNNTLLRNRNSTAIMFRRRLQIVSNLQYYLPQFLGGRHEFKFGFDNGFTPEDVDTYRVDNVNLTYRSGPVGTNPAGPVSVQIFNSPLHVERAVMTTALYGQDSYAIGRLTLTAGVRWERIEGYLPAQVTGASEYFPDGLVFRGVTINGVVQDYTVRKSFPEVRENPLWHNMAPRFNATYDLFGNGRTVLKGSWGRYLDQINTGTPPNPNASINQTYVWNDLDADLNFDRGNAFWDGLRYVGGEFGPQQGGTGGLAVAIFDPTLRRPYREETTLGIDRELVPGIRGGLTYIHRRSRDVQGTLDQSMDLWPSLYTQVAVTDPGRDGCFGTETTGSCLAVSNPATDNIALNVYSQNPGAVTSQVTVNDDRLAVYYDGIEATVEKRFSRGWTVLGGYTYSHTRVDLTSLSNPNNVFVNAKGESGGRRHQLKVNGSYTLPYQIVTGVEYRVQSGLPITRTLNVQQCTATVTTNCVNQNNLSVNAEERGSVLLPVLGTLDVRAGRFFNMGKNRIEATMDVYNLTNANTTYDVRTGTGRTNVRFANDPTQPQTGIQTFLSPTGVLGPRIIRFNITYWFQ
jgi:carboxypeptidase family protein/TonB-dependent receptor-like protein